MSSIFDFIKNLNPHIKKTVVQRDLENTIKELSSFTLSMVKTLADKTAASPLTNPWFETFESRLRDGVKFERKSKNVWLDLHAVLTNVLANAEKLSKFVEDYLQEDTIRDGITFRASHMVRLAGAMSFVTNYTAEIADFAVAMENVAKGDENVTPPAQQQYLTQNIDKYIGCLKDVSVTPKDFERMFNDIPSAFMSGDTQAVRGMFSEKELDPYVGMKGVTGWTGSPIFAVRMMWESYQADRFQTMKERKSIMELRLIHLENQRNSSENPRLQKEIDGLQARISKYDRKIREIEASI